MRSRTLSFIVALELLLLAAPADAKIGLRVVGLF